MNARGATPAEWAHFRQLPLCAAHLLPVVCDPDAQVSPGSTLTITGKTPCVYNRQGKVTGIKGWPVCAISADMLDRWQQNPALGICLRTGRAAIAIDNDSDDPHIAELVDKAITGILGKPVPRRWRDNSRKCLYLLKPEATDVPKRILRLADGLGIVELLGTGQQCVIAGTHISGSRIRWWYDCRETLPPEIPAISTTQLQALWQRLKDTLPVKTESTAGQRGARNAPGGTASRDPVAQWLDVNNWTLRTGAEQQRYITCPWAANHSTGGDDTATVYFPAGSREYPDGHFVCLHAGCACHSDTDFQHATGYTASRFTATGNTDRDLPAVSRDKSGAIPATLTNICLWLGHEYPSGYRLALDQFRHTLMFRRPGTDWQPFADGDAIRLRVLLEHQGFKPVGRELMRDAVLMLAQASAFDPVTGWLNGLTWDGTDRISTFFSAYMGAPDTPYTRSVAAYVFTAHAGRILQPGIKADMMPVLSGEQGCGKSSGVAALAGEDWCCEVSFKESDDDIARKLCYAVAAEVSELRGLQSRDAECIKALITRTSDAWRQKYQEHITIRPRRNLFWGTTNESEFLSDMTGNRRYLPVRVGPVAVDRIREDRDQLWAQARVMFRNGGIRFARTEQLARAEHQQYQIRDPWLEITEDWLYRSSEFEEGCPAQRGGLRLCDVLRGAVGLEASRTGSREERRMATVLKALGYSVKVRWADGKSVRLWEKPPEGR